MYSGSASDGGGRSPNSEAAKSAENVSESLLHTSSSSKTSMSTAFKASGALARLGKAIYSGGSALAIGGVPKNDTVFSSADHSMSSFVQKAKKLTYKTKSGIISMCQSDDREHVAIAGHDFLQVVHIEPDNIRFERDLRAHKTRLFDKVYTVTDLKWGHNHYSNMIALGTSGGDIFIYDAEQEGVPKYRMSVLNRGVNTLAFSTKAPSQLLSGSQDGVIRLWDLRQGSKPVLQFNKNGDNAREVQFRPLDNRNFAAIYYSGLIQKWDIRNSHSAELKINAHAGNGLTIDWHQELDYIASGGRDKQIQIWNLATDHREPEYVIRAPNSVSTVRWQYSESRPKSILHSTLASAGGRQDFNTHIWNIGRPNIPLYVLESHTDMVSEIQFVNSNVVRTASKDCYLIQHDLSSEPRLVDNLPTQAIDWLDSQDLTFVAQKKDPEMRYLPKSRTSSAAFSDDGINHVLTSQHSEEQIWRRNRRPGSMSASDSHHSTRPSSSRASYSILPPIEMNKLIDQEFICNAMLPIEDPADFSSLANSYRLYALPHELLSDVCNENVNSTATILKFRTSNTWRILAEAIKREERDFEKCRDKLEAAVNHSQTFSDEHVSLLSEEIKKLSPLTSMKASESPRRATDSESFRIPSKESSIMNKSLSAESHATSAAVPIKDSRNVLDNSFGTPNTILHPPTSVAISGSPDDTYGQARGLGGHSFTQLAMESSIGSDNKDHLRGSSFSTVESNGTDRRPSYDAESSVSPRISDRLSVIEDDPNEHENEMAIKHEDNTHEMEMIDTPTKPNYFRIYLDSLTHPWRAEMLIEKAIEFALAQGDVQFLVSVSSLLRSVYWKAFPSLDRVTEWYDMYIRLLNRSCEFVVSAEIIKDTDIKSIQQRGTTKTSFEILCGRCEAPLTDTGKVESNEFSGYRFCSSCQNLLNGCVICNTPIRKRAVIFFGCGHTCHFECLKSWVIDEKMNVCPSGCSNVII